LTDRYLELDPTPLFSRPLVLFRLADELYADLSGIGSKISGARWNPRGQEAIYTSIDTSLPVLEYRAHWIEETPIPSNLVIMRILVDSDFEMVWMKRGYNLTPPPPFQRRSRRSPYEKTPQMRYFQTLAEAEQAYDKEEGFGAPIQGVKRAPNFLREPPFAVALPSVVSPTWNVVLFPMAFGFEECVRLDTTQRYEYDDRFFPSGTLRQSGRP
jgi:RES domain-containing protein